MKAVLAATASLVALNGAQPAEAQRGQPSLEITHGVYSGGFDGTLQYGESVWIPYSSFFGAVGGTCWLEVLPHAKGGPRIEDGFGISLGQGAPVSTRGNANPQWHQDYRYTRMQTILNATVAPERIREGFGPNSQRTALMMRYNYTENQTTEEFGADGRSRGSQLVSPYNICKDGFEHARRSFRIDLGMKPRPH